MREGAQIGAHTSIGQCCYIDAGAILGQFCKIQNGVSIYDGVVLGNGVMVGPNVTFTNDKHPRVEGEWAVTPTVVCEGVGIGANATIVCGVVLHEWCMVGAGSVVTENVPAHALVVGCPAQVVDYVTKRGRPLKWDVRLGPPPAALLADAQK